VNVNGGWVGKRASAGRGENAEVGAAVASSSAFATLSVLNAELGGRIASTSALSRPGRTRSPTRSPTQPQLTFTTADAKAADA